MLLSILMTVFGLVALFEGLFLLTHLHKAFLVFDPTKSNYLPGQMKGWGIVMTIVGVLCVIAAWTNSIAFIVSMVVIGCIAETMMAFAIAADLKINKR